METLLPPNSNEAEVNILGCLLLNNDTIPIAVGMINVEDFYSKKHQDIYEAIISLYKENSVVDMVTVDQRLKVEGKFIETSYLALLLQQTITTSNIKKHLEIVKTKANLRTLIKFTHELQKKAFTAEESAGLLIEAKNKLDELLISNLSGEAESTLKLLEAHLELLDKRSRGEIKGIKTGFEALDHRLQFEAGQLITIAGRTSMGKSAFAINLLYNIAKETKVGFFSLESNKHSIIDRLIAIDSGLNLWKIRKGLLNDWEHSRLLQSLDNISKLQFVIDDTANISLSELMMNSLRMANNGVGIIFVDYIGLTRAPKQQSREREVAVVMSTLKSLAKKLGIPIVALSQLSRAVEYRGEKKPTLADLRESGSIEQDSDIVLFLYRKDYYEGDNNEENCEIIIAKHREGATGFEVLEFNKNCVKFSNKKEYKDYKTAQAGE